MNLGQIRAMFIQLSGRADLVVNPASSLFFIQSGIKYLESVTNVLMNNGLHVVELTSGAYTFDVPNIRKIHSVKVIDPDTEKVVGTVNPLGYFELLDKFEGSFSKTGIPTYYAATPQNTSTITPLGGTTETFSGIDVFAIQEHYLIYPAASRALRLHISGLFSQSQKLTSDTQENWWTANHSDLVLYASLYVLESFYRNTEGMKDWLNAMQPLLNSLEADVVQREADDADEMRG